MLKLVHKKAQKWLGWIGLIILANFLLSGVLLRWDLTKEKRYSLTPISRETARELSYPLEVTAYMEGTYPLEISRFQQRVYTTLEELDSHARGLIQIRYVDPNEVGAARDTLRKRGFTPIGVRVQSSATEMSQKALYPVLHFQYGDRFRWVDVLKDYTLPQSREGVNVDLVKAEANLEYELVSAIRGLLRERPPTVAFLQGHGELSWQEWAPDIRQEMVANYLFGELDLQALQGQPIDSQIDVILIVQPKEAFGERDKYELDQYLMRGGKICWIMDYQRVDFDMSRKENALTLLYELNLDDFFFQHGVKLNPDLILDLSCEKVEFLEETASGDRFESLPWVLHPLLKRLPSIPISRNVESILLRYASSIDTVPKQGMRKTVMLASSSQSRRLDNTSFLDINSLLASTSQPQLFNQGPFTTGVLLEGQFTSLFEGRGIPTDSLVPMPSAVPFTGVGQKGMMALIADGEFLLGENFRGQRGFSPPDNRTFFLNMLDYLLGDPSLSQIRAKEVMLRPLDTQKIGNSALTLRILNILLPLFLLTGIGIVRAFLRKRKARQYMPEA